MKHTRSHITAACAYLERGLPRKARAELDALAAQDANSWRALVLRVSVHMDLEEWELMRRAADHLAVTCPEDSRWPLCVAYATRRLESVERARAVLLKAEPHFPADAGIKYNLSCFTAQLGDLPAAKVYLRDAFELNPGWKDAARHEPDLAPLRESLDDL